MFYDEKVVKSIRDIIEDAPKTLHKEYLQTLYAALINKNLDSTTDIDAIVSSLLLLVIDFEASISRRHLATVILQRLPPITDISEIINLDVGYSLVYALPVLLAQNIDDFGTKSVIRKLAWCLCNENWPVEYQWKLLTFLSKVVVSAKSPLTQGDMTKITSLLSEWLITPASIPISNRMQGFRKSPSSLSITEIDGSTAQDFFTILNYAKQRLTAVGNYGSEELSLSIREYCLRIIDQVDRRTASDSMAQFQKACVIEAIHLFNIICLMDSGIVHSIFPIIRRIYDYTFSNASKDPEAQDVAVMASSMQFFMNHGSSVMHKPDSLYTYLFCDLLNVCYKDNYITFEILQLMKDNLSQLCYHSSILEKYFPTFLKVLAWRPTTFIDDFLELLPSFLSQNTSIEVFHSLLDLPCLTAVLILTDSKASGSESGLLKDPSLVEGVKKPEVTSAIKFLLRKTSGISDIHKSAVILHQVLATVGSKSRVLYCAEVVVPLLKRYFEVILQYADISLASFLITAILERLPLIFPANYSDEIHCVLSDATLQFFELHPEVVFHCTKNIASYISHFKNYYVAEQNFIHVIWAVGEYVSVEYSDICRPEVIALFFENLESTTYEALSALQRSSDEKFLKLLSVSLTTLSKLAARNQDQVPRAVLCLSKAQQQVLSFGNDYKEPWKIVTERLSELLSILNSPSVASIVLSPSRTLESGKLHRDPTSLPYVLRTVTSIVSKDSS
ncbi:AP-5 complex subunit zeta-1 isoform X2 [Parasteatoda tepidariorum]|uniref:AP-5 complex subunit zeta-1 isoform X2 n=1 Tax=Parasteatoda tepidariorum TaxID=114398 RepID=UPI001C724E82|nr:AP-5 complex subunit zeta-1 isoform X2 [Parasteatoda tepidariorum]